jgi:hypothetical protein
LIYKPFYEDKNFKGTSFKRRKDNIRVDLREGGWEAVGWMHLAQIRDQLQALTNTTMNLRVP